MDTTPITLHIPDFTSPHILSRSYHSSPHFRIRNSSKPIGEGAWNDVTVTQINREEAHTLAIPFATAEEDVRNKSIEQSPYFLSLNGTWKFRWTGNPETKPAGFQENNFNTNDWDDITAPSVWQLYGIRHGKEWDQPLYVNTRYPFTYDGTPRRDGENGNIRDFDLFLSNDPNVWGNPVVSGQFGNNSTPQSIKISSKPEVRYFKLVAKSEVNGRPWASAAELGIKASVRK